MELSKFISENGFQNVIFIDDDLPLIEGNMLVSDFLEKRPEFRQDVAEYCQPEDLSKLAMKNLDKRLFMELVDKLSLKGTAKIVDDIKKANVNLVIRDNFYDDLSSYDNAIWFVDRALNSSQGNNNKLHIKRAFNIFFENRKKRKKDLFLLYTNDNNGLLKYDETVKYLKDNDIFDSDEDSRILYFNVVSKLDKEFGADSLETIVEKAIQADYFTELSKSIKESIGKVKRSLWNSEELAKAMNYNCVMEGITKDKNLYGITIGSVENAFINSKKNQEIKAIIKQLNGTNCEIGCGNGYLSTAKIRAFHDLRQFASCERVDTTINEFGYDVAYGDVFEINGKRYVVVSQQCDITIRAGERKLKFFRLIPIKFNQRNEKNMIKRIVKNVIEQSSETLTAEEKNEIGSYLNDRVENDELNLSIKGNQLIDMIKGIPQQGHGNPSDEEANDFEIDSPYVRMDDILYSLTVQKKESELIVDDYLLDVVSHNGDNGLNINKNSKPVLSRSASRLIVEDAFKKLIEDQQKIDQELQYKFGASRNGWKRIGNISQKLTNAIYSEFIENQTREALLHFEMV